MITFQRSDWITVRTPPVLMVCVSPGLGGIPVTAVEHHGPGSCVVNYIVVFFLLHIAVVVVVVVAVVVVVNITVVVLDITDVVFIVNIIFIIDLTI